MSQILKSFRDQHGVLLRVALREPLDAASHRAPSPASPAGPASPPCRPSRSPATARPSSPSRRLVLVPPLQRIEPQAAHLVRVRVRVRVRANQVYCMKSLVSAWRLVLCSTCCQ